jgi:hypothetical protein
MAWELIRAVAQAMSTSASADGGRSQLSSSVLMQSIFLEDHSRSGLKLSSCQLDSSGALMLAGKLSGEQLSASSRAPIAPAAGSGYSPLLGPEQGSDGGNHDDNDDAGDWGEAAADNWSDRGAETGPAEARPMVAAAAGEKEEEPVRGSGSRGEAKRPAGNPLRLLDPHSAVQEESAGFSGPSRPLRVSQQCFRASRPARAAAASKQMSEFDLFARSLCSSFAVRCQYSLGKRSGTEVSATASNEFGWSAGAKASPATAVRVSGVLNRGALDSIIRQRKRQYFLAATRGAPPRAVAPAVASAAAVDPSAHRMALAAEYGEDDDSREQDDNDHFGFDAAWGPDDEDEPHAHTDGEPATSDARPGETDRERAVELALAASSAADDHTAPFEALCKRHMEGFLLHAEAYARETQLSRRISDWVSRIEPLLQEQDARPSFDIDAYSDKVLCRASVEAMAEKQVKGAKAGALLSEACIPFEHVVSGEEPFEVCRVFAACLQLANYGSIEISRVGAGGSGGGDDMGFSFSLLSASRPRGVENYRAPSAAN